MDFHETRKITDLDELLKMDVLELKTQIEENELVYGINTKKMGSMYIPKDPEFFKKKRKLNLQRLLNDGVDRSGKVLADVLMMELDSCDKLEYREKSMPLLIRQFTLNRISELANMKHMLMLRWVRYCVTKQLQATIASDYAERLDVINNEYLELHKRLVRLNSTEEGYISKSDMGLDDVTTEDMVRYLEFLVVHFHSVRFMCYIVRLIQWSPFKCNKKIVDKKESLSSRSDKSVMRFRRSMSDTSTSGLHSSSFVKALPSAEMLQHLAGMGRETPSEGGMSGRRSLSPAQGGGLATDELNSNIPLHTNTLVHFERLLEHLCATYAVEMNISALRSSADEMELFGHVNRRFRLVFAVQEHMRTFRVYDIKDTKSEKWSSDSCNHALLKPATWLTKIPFVTKSNVFVDKYINMLRKDNIRDEVLVCAAYFVKLSNCEEMQNNLRHHALMIQHMPVVNNTSVTSNPKGLNISDIFKMIYSKYEFNVAFSKSSTSSEKATGVLSDLDDYNFVEMLQNLGLDECSNSKDEPSTVQGTFLSYLHLRVLKIRDLQRTSLSILNYFRSLERTLVINHFGYSKRATVTDTKKEENMFIFKGENIGNHGYLHNRVHDFTVSESQFMKFGEIENHDDFYFHEDGRVHVRDDKGHWIVYDAALRDMESLEDELILVASHYINADKELRMSSLFKRKRNQNEDSHQPNFYVSEYGHREVDRFGVLYDLWCLHTAFLEAKKKLVDIHMETYNNVCKRRNRESIAALIYDLMHRRPRLDTGSFYFIFSYRYEILILMKIIDIVTKILNGDFLKSRAYSEKVLSQSPAYKFIPKLLLAVNTDKPILEMPFLMEFCPSWSMITHLNKALQYACQNVQRQSEETAMTLILKKELALLDGIEKEIEEADDFLGNAYDIDVKQNFLSTNILDNPRSVSEMAGQYLKSIDNRNSRGDKRTRKVRIINEFGRFLELVTLRFRLVDCLLECNYLRRLYNNQALTLGYDENHYNLRLLGFETAVHNKAADNGRPLLYISSVQDDDSILDRYNPQFQCLAIQELDRVHIGNFSIISMNDVIQILESKKLENLQMTLKVQYAHKSALASSVLLCDACKPSAYKHEEEDEEDVDQRSESVISSPNNFVLPVCAQSGPTPLALDTGRFSIFHLNDAHPEAFFSLQLEKALIRDKMLNSFLRKNPNPIKVAEPDIEKSKTEAIGFFTASFADRIALAAHRSQIVSCYNSIIRLLQTVPDIALDFFQFGHSQTLRRKSLYRHHSSNTDYGDRTLRIRPRVVLSNDGSQLLNLWYIPHFTEILFYHRETEDVKALQIFSNYVRLLMNFHDILHYLVGFSQLNLRNTRPSDQLKTFVFSQSRMVNEHSTQNIVHNLHKESENQLPFFTDYDDSGNYQLRKDLTELEVQIKSLNEPCAVEEAIKVLEAKRNFLYFYFEISVSVYLNEIFLACNEEDSYKALQSGLATTMPLFCNTAHTSIIVQNLNVPLPLKYFDPETKTLFPWRSQCRQHGPFMMALDSGVNVSEAIQTCLAGIPHRNQYLIEAAFVRMNLMLEDMLIEKNQFQGQNLEFVKENNDMLLISKKLQRHEKKEEKHLDKAGLVAPVSVDSLEERPQPATGTITATSSPETETLPKLRQQPLACYCLLTSFLQSLKNITILRYLEGLRMLKLDFLHNSETYRAITDLFRIRILHPFLRKLGLDLNQPMLYFLGPSSANEIDVYPPGIPHHTILLRLMNVLIESLERTHIFSMRNRINLLIDSTVKDRNHDEFHNNHKNHLFKCIKNEYLQPTLVLAVVQKMEIPDSAEEDMVEATAASNVSNVVVESASTSPVMAQMQLQNRLISSSCSNSSSDTEIDSSGAGGQSDTGMIIVAKKSLNTALQYLGISVQRAQRESYETCAMFFENQLKHQQALLRVQAQQLGSMRALLHMKQQSVSVERQFILAEKTAAFITEINLLWEWVNRQTDKEMENEQTAKRDILCEYKLIVRNIFSLGYELMTRILVARKRFQADVLCRINDERIRASQEMNKIKDRSGSMVTSDDELANRNIEMSKEIMKSSIANIHVEQLTLSMKSLYNWIFNYTLNVQNCALLKETKALKFQRVDVVVIKIDAQQKLKIIKCEHKRLKETLTTTNKNLFDLKLTLSEELLQKSQKKQSADLQAEKIRELTLQKQKQIKVLIKQLQILNAKLLTMNLKCDEHTSSQKSVFFRSHNEVDRLRKLLLQARIDKKTAFQKVDELLIQVYEFESTFAILQERKRSKGRTKVVREELSKPRHPISKPGRPVLDANYPSRRPPNKNFTYKTIISRHNLPYTSSHFLPFRRDSLTIQKMRMKIRSKLSENKPSSTDKLVLPKIRRNSSKE